MNIGKLNFPDAKLGRVEYDYALKDFDCDDIDLNDFFNNDAKPSIKQLLTVTNVIEAEEVTIAFYSLLNDKISIDDAQSNRWRKKKIRDKKFPHVSKRFTSYPAVKIGRLGVNKQFQRKAIGTFILDSIKNKFIDNNRTGCRFITVDAYNKEDTLKFYERNGFKYLLKKDAKQDDKTRLMYFDLLTILNAQNISPQASIAQIASGQSS